MKRSGWLSLACGGYIGQAPGGSQSWGAALAWADSRQPVNKHQPTTNFNFNSSRETHSHSHHDQLLVPAGITYDLSPSVEAHYLPHPPAWRRSYLPPSLLYFTEIPASARPRPASGVSDWVQADTGARAPPPHTDPRPTQHSARSRYCKILLVRILITEICSAPMDTVGWAPMPPPPTQALIIITWSGA